MGLKVVLFNPSVHPATTYALDPSYFYLHRTFQTFTMRTECSPVSVMCTISIFAAARRVKQPFPPEKASVGCAAPRFPQICFPLSFKCCQCVKSLNIFPLRTFFFCSGKAVPTVLWIMSQCAPGCCDVLDPITQLYTALHNKLQAASWTDIQNQHAQCVET